MALIDLQTNLLNLKYPQPPNFNKVPNEQNKLETMFVNGSTDFTTQKYSLDRPGGGYSGLPYIKTSVPPVPYLISTTGPGFPLYLPGSTGGLDYPIRGGEVKFQIGQQTFTLSGVIDKTRISRFFEDTPRGTSFIQKQIGLQLSNPKIETQNTLFGIGGELTFPGLLENTRVYNKGINTLSQVLHSGTGAHAVRHGTLPFPMADRYYFYTVNKQNIENEKSTNRLVNLAILKITAGNTQFVNTQNALDVGTVSTLGISLNRSVMFDYLGGPGSTYGIGKTLIRRYQDTTQLGVTVKNFASRNAMVYDQLRDASDKNTSSNGTRTTGIYDFELTRLESTSPQAKEYDAKLQALRNKRTKNQNAINALIPDVVNDDLTIDEEKWNDFKQSRDGKKYLRKKKRRSRLDDKIDLLEKNPPPGASASPVKTWTAKDTVESRFYDEGTDKINSSNSFVIDSSNGKDPWAYNKEDTDDLIKFGFEAISNDDPNVCQVILFRAFLTSAITDNHDGEWSNFRYVGRGEQFYTYQGFSRTMGFSFRIAALSSEEMRPMYNRLNSLVSQVYPDYSPITKAMRAPIVKLTIGDYIYRMPGILDSVNISIDNTTPWDVKAGGGPEFGELPKMLDVQISFKPILQYMPTRNKIGAISRESAKETTSLQSKINQIPLIATANGLIDASLDTTAIFSNI